MSASNRFPRHTVKVAVASVALAGLGALVGIRLVPEASLGTVVFLAVVGAIALFGAAKAVLVALAAFRQVTAQGDRTPPPAP